MKRSNFFFLLVIIMAGIGLYKYKSMNSAVKPDAQPVVQQENNENSSLVLTDEGVGLTDEAKKGLVSEIIDNPIPEDSPEQSQSDGITEEPITVTGPNTLPKEECMKKYKNVLPDISLYTSVSMIPNYSLCHAIAEENVQYCQGHDRCEKQAYDILHLYHVLNNNPEANKKYCEKVISESAQKKTGRSAAQICNLIASIDKGRAKPPARFANAFAYTSGRMASCSVVEDKYEREVCKYKADVVSGVKTGISKTFVYDALTKHTCEEPDKDLLEKYCSNKLLSKDEVEKRLSSQAKKKKGIKNKR